MGFINPWLLVGLAGISVPIIIHLLNRFRHKEVEWGAMELLRRAIVLRSRQVQMEDILLLILRCLAVALIALAMARPTIRGGAAGWFGRSSDVAMLVAIDGSYSMDYRQGVESRFGKAVQQAKEIFQTAEPGTPVTLVLLGDRPRILLRNAGYTQQRVDKALSEAKPLPERLNLERCAETLAALVEELKAPRRECYIISDSQAATWAQVSDVTRRSIERTASSAACYFVCTPADAGDNLAITRFELASGQERRGTIARYLAEVTNTGRATQVGVAVVLSANGQPHGYALHSLRPRRRGPTQRAARPVGRAGDRQRPLRRRQRARHHSRAAGGRRFI